MSTFPETPLEPARVERVVDGDTIIVQFGGERRRVRLTGINTPESVAPQEERNCPEGVEASERTKHLVHPDQHVWLQRDVSDVDEYDRLLRYVWLEKPADPGNTGEIRHKMLNARLVEEGFAEPHRYGPDTTLYDFFCGLAGE